MAYLDPTFGVEIECYLPVGVTHAQAAAAVQTSLLTLNAPGAFVPQDLTCRAEAWSKTLRPYWRIITDGSLGDYARGMELIAPKLQGERGFAVLTAAMNALKALGCDVTTQTGLHVHVDAGQPTTQFFKNLLKTYAHFEPVIDAFMPKSRRKNNTAQYIATVANLGLLAIERAQDLTALIRMMTRPGHHPRYHKLNIVAYRQHGTVEFRQHSGTVEAEKGVAWVKLCLRMVQAAKDNRSIPADGGAPVNKARAGSKAHLVGNLMLRANGVTREEARTACGWPAISIPQQARACGLAYTTQRTGHVVRYFALAAAAATQVPATLPAMFDLLGCEPEDRTYFIARTARFSGQGSVAWAA